MRRKNDRLLWIVLFGCLAVNLLVSSLSMKMIGRFDRLLDNMEQQEKCVKMSKGIPVSQ